jgi:imidazolonepropionase-like amidohydrolase
MYVRAGRLFDGTGSEPRQGVLISIEEGLITGVDEGPEPGRRADVLDLDDLFVLPGMVNMHAHLVLPGDGTPFAEWMELPDELLLLKAYANALVALRSGVTTIRDCGGKGRLPFRLRDAIRQGIVAGPRLVLAGRPLTITGGHCHYFGGETDGPDAMRQAARQLLAEGADFIKIMAAGGGTVGTYPQFPAYEVDELRAAIAEAHKVGKPASCHCIATESIRRALDAGTDHIEHCSFVTPQTTVHYDDEVAARLAAARPYVTATLQVIADLPEGFTERQARGEVTTAEAEQVAGAERRFATHLDTIGRLHRLGVPMVAGNDAGWRNTGFDDFYLEIVYLAQAGLSSCQALHAATGQAARACGLSGKVGTIQAGAAADLLAVAGDPLSDLNVLRDPVLVIQAGRTVVDRRNFLEVKKGA